MTKTTSLGFECVQFADWVRARIEQVAAEREEPELLDLAPKLLEWQRWFLIHALELLPGADKVFRFRTVLLLVARQNGKTSILIYLILWRMFTDGSRLVIGTAQNLDIAEEAWQKVVEIAEAIPELEAEIRKVNKTNGKQALILETRERYKIAPSSRRGPRSLSGDLVILDELREQQSWDAWGAASKTTMARPRAQVYGVSNAGDAASIVLRHLRQMCLRSLVESGQDSLRAELDDDTDEIVDRALSEYAEDGVGDAELFANGEDDSLAIFEWSAPPGCHVRDRDGWACANPSLGYTITESAIASAARTDPEWVFRTEVLCQWVSTATGGPFPDGAWQAGLDPTSKVAAGEHIGVCVDASWDRSTAHIGMAGERDDGGTHVAIVASRAGMDWVVGWLQSDAAPPFAAVAVQANGPAGALVKPLREAGFEVLEWAGTELGRGTGAFYDAVRAHLPAPEGEEDDEDLAEASRVYHRAQPLLDLAASTAVPKMLDGGSMLWDRKKSPHDASPLVAVTGALWGLGSAEKPARSYYEDHDLTIA